MDSGVAMLKDVLIVADSVIVSEEYNPWSVFWDGCNQQVVYDLQSCQEKVLLRRKASRDTSERWFRARSAGSPSAGTTAVHSGVRNSNTLEEGQVEYVAVLEPDASSSRSVKSPVIGSKGKACISSGPMPRESFAVVSPVRSLHKCNVDDPGFSAALDREASGSRRRSGCERRLPLIFEFAKKN